MQGPPPGLPEAAFCLQLFTLCFLLPQGGPSAFGADTKRTLSALILRVLLQEGGEKQRLCPVLVQKTLK